MQTVNFAFDKKVNLNNSVIKLVKNKFRRQFLLSPKESKALILWRAVALGSHLLYVHPDCLLTHMNRNNKDVIILGHVLNPNVSRECPLSIADKVVSAENEKEIAKILYGLTGRFVLMVHKHGVFTFFNDACGLKSMFYTSQNEGFYAASQPALLDLVLEKPLTKGERYQSYLESDYVKNNKEHWFPSGTSLYEGVFHLVPNHYLETAAMKQVRYWPIDDITPIPYDEGKTFAAEHLKKTMEIAVTKYNLALGVTSGYDSRILFSACKNVKENLMFYTLKYRNLNDSSDDVRIPNTLAKKLNIPHKLFDCRFKTPQEFLKIYEQNSDMAHTHDWGHIAYGISQHIPDGVMAVKGSCSETARCFFYYNGKHPKLKSHRDILNLKPNWKNIPFIDNQIKVWYADVSDPNRNKGFQVLDLFHWEVSTGSWQMQSQLEWDLVHDTFTPFNNRELLETLLRIETKYRCEPDYKLYRDVIQMLWPELLWEPINPESTQRKIRKSLKRFLVKIGFEKYNKIN